MMSDLEYFCNFFGVDSIVDRTGLSKTLPINFTIPIPETIENCTLEEAIEKRLEELEKSTLDKYLLWSGGIDSTLAFYALISKNIDFTLITNKNSKLEYPKLHSEILDGKFPNVKEIKYISVDEIEPGEKTLFITGEIGDQISGSIVFKRYTPLERNSNYKNVVDRRIIDMTFDSVISLTKNPDMTTTEYIWALNFIYKYENVVERIKTNTKPGVEFFHFFDTPSFQSWAINNYKTNCKFDNWKEYKTALKTIIFNYNGDEHYFKNKTKVPSLKFSGILNRS